MGIDKFRKLASAVGDLEQADFVTAKPKAELLRVLICGVITGARDKYGYYFF